MSELAWLIGFEVKSLLRRVSQLLWIRRAQGQVVVVAHYDKGVDIPSATPHRLQNRTLESFAAPPLSEQIFAVVPRADDVKGRARILDSLFSRHET